MVPPASDSNSLCLTCTRIVLQPATSSLNSTTINAGVKKAILEEKSRIHFAVAFGKYSTPVGNEAAKLLGFPQSIDFCTGWTSVPTANLAKCVPFYPAVTKLIDIQTNEATRGLQVIFYISIVPPTQTICAVLHVAGNCYRQKCLPVIDHLQAKVCFNNNVKTKCKYIHFAMAQLQRQIKSFIIYLQKNKIQYVNYLQLM